MPSTKEREIRDTDRKGRVSLGVRYANSTFEQQEKKDGSILLVPVVQVSIPKEEAWLFQNPTALESVKTGIKQAASGQFSEDPRGKKDPSWLKDIED